MILDATGRALPCANCGAPADPDDWPERFHDVVGDGSFRDDGGRLNYLCMDCWFLNWQPGHHDDDE